MARYGKEKAAPLIGRLLKTCAALRCTGVTCVQQHLAIHA
jgi:hypothetical protein